MAATQHLLDVDGLSWPELQRRLAVAEQMRAIRKELGDTGPGAQDVARRVEAAATRLRRLGWKKSAALLVVMIAGRGDALTDWATDLDCCDAWNGRPLTAPVHLALPGARRLS